MARVCCYSHAATTRGRRDCVNSTPRLGNISRSNEEVSPSNPSNSQNLSNLQNPLLRFRAIGGMPVSNRGAGNLTPMHPQDVEVDNEGGARQFRAGSRSQNDRQASLLCVAAERLHSSRSGSVWNP